MNEIAQAGHNSLPAQIKPPQERGTRIAALEAAKQRAIRIKDPVAIREATAQTLSEMAETAREYQALFPHGDVSRFQDDSTGALEITSEKYLAALGYSQRTVQRWAKKLIDPDAFEDEVEKLTSRYMKGVVADAEKGDPFAKNWTGEPEWYTPAKYIDSARAVMGSIDLDPASNKTANKVVEASTFYTEKDNGLEHPWGGTVWLNPPYKMPAVKQFCERLVEHVSSGAVTQAIILTNNATDTSWWHLLTSCSAGVCFTSGRISFQGPNDEQSAPTNGQNFHYFGDRHQAFVDAFSLHGMCMVRS